MKKAIKDKLDRTDMRMIRLMCRVLLRDKETKAILERIGVEAANDVMKKNRVKVAGACQVENRGCLGEGIHGYAVPGVRPKGQNAKHVMRNGEE